MIPVQFLLAAAYRDRWGDPLDARPAKTKPRRSLAGSIRRLFGGDRGRSPSARPFDHPLVADAVLQAATRYRDAPTPPQTAHPLRGATAMSRVSA